ncbi:FAD-dependent monooxygenase [Shewanella sp. AS1]|uniref:FAD-dependent monooxygenase n=1 Tax=Shewanella sp. AS1 TaxID=2907626 RepID=UPI001F445258|nr:FAD-dependent monooxygenase [Shewanella sp. AS1]
MVGAATAIGLAKLGLDVVLVEAYEPKAFSPEQPLDLRVSAISVASEKLLADMGALETIQSMRQVAYKGLETWEMEGFITRFHSDQIGASHLGHIVENRVIQLALWQEFAKYPNLHLICPAKVTQFERIDDGISLTLCVDGADSQARLRCRLLVGADGANSQVRQWAGIGVTGWDYAQAAMLINIATQTPQQDVTWQQFTPKGPRSLLPLPGKHASLVWYDDANRIAQLTSLSHSALKEQINKAFPKRLDREFSVLSQGSFKLTRRHADRYFDDNLVLLGDAAHTINPLAGQGVNLGFKDVTALIACLSDAIEKQAPWWNKALLAQYQAKRYRDNQLMMTTMDLFYASFSNDILPLKWLRNSALKVADIDSPIKKKVLKYALGLE